MKNDDSRNYTNLSLEQRLEVSALSETAFHCPEGLTPLEWQWLKDYRKFHGA